MSRTTFFLFLVLGLVFSCEKTGTETPVVKPKISVKDSEVFEKPSSTSLTFEVATESLETEDLNFTYVVEGGTAIPGEDFIAGEGSSAILAGEFSTIITVEVIDDNLKEVDEKVIIRISGDDNIEITDEEAIGLIKDNDEADYSDSDGYSTSKSHFGYDLAWEEEFDGNELDESIYNYELGDGCPNLCGWGNDEKQQYTDLPENISVENSQLIITADKAGPGTYNSARIQTKGKKEVKFGRIDIRAKLPKGQGIWPAIWMLGRNIDQVGWPVCGEIDIMELVGHQPKSSHGTAHWGAPGDGGSTYATSTYVIDEDFNERFHVFSIVWEFNEMVWYVDETRFHKITINEMKGKPYPFNQPYFFVFNIAVGGGWPGDPDASTVFPQEMIVDYVRVFQ